MSVGTSVIVIQATSERLLLGKSAGDIALMSLPMDEYHRRVRISALILCEGREGSEWRYDHMDVKGRTLWSAMPGGTGRCNVDPASKHVVRG